MPIDRQLCKQEDLDLVERNQLSVFPWRGQFSPGVSGEGVCHEVSATEDGARVAQRGSEHSDEMTPDGFLSNNAGGILGGISTGQDVVVTIAVKPTSSIRLDRRSIDKAGNAVTVNTHGRHDPCVGIRATPIAEAMMALVLIDHALRHRAQNADVVTATPRIPAAAPPNVARGERGNAVDDPDPDEA